MYVRSFLIIYPVKDVMEKKKNYYCEITSHLCRDQFDEREDGSDIGSRRGQL